MYNMCLYNNYMIIRGEVIQVENEDLKGKIFG
jgi:hypothetical protein